MDNPSDATRVLFTGRVQGVGFRMTTAAISRKFPVTGFVRNLPDGDVELVAQGETNAIRCFLAAITERFQRNIRGATESPVDFDRRLTSFEIRR